MAYTYLLDLYKALHVRMNDIGKALSDGRGLPADRRQHLLGRRDCLESIHCFLEEQYDHKLPRRLQGQSKQAQ
jgi:hypothetical protein